MGSYLGEKVDVWASGLVIFIMLAGFPPLEKADLTDWYFKRLHRGQLDSFWKMHERSANFSRQAKSLIEGMLEPDAKKRFTLAQALAHPWFSICKLLTNSQLLLKMQPRGDVVERAKLVELRRNRERPTNHQLDPYAEDVYRSHSLDNENASSQSTKLGEVAAPTPRLRRGNWVGNVAIIR